MKTLIQTVTYIVVGDQILLGYKKVRLGAGLYNGFGGNVEEGEDPLRTAAREINEESGLTVDAARLRVCGTAITKKPFSPVVIKLHFFLATSCEGEARETDEMIPRWFPLSSMPYESMWATDALLLPRFLAGKKCSATFLIENPRTVVRYCIKTIG